MSSFVRKAEYKSWLDITVLSINNISCHDNPYAWWQVRKYNFPCLIKTTAKCFLAPENSIYSERFFSETGMIYENKRSNDAEKLVFLHLNLRLLNFDYSNNSNKF